MAEAEVKARKSHSRKTPQPRASKGLELESTPKSKTKANETGESSSKAEKQQTKKSKKRNWNSFSTYSYKVLKTIHPDLGITKTAMSVVDSLLHDLLDRIADEAKSLLKKERKKVLSAREIQTAVHLTLTGQLCQYAMAEGSKALTKYNANS